MDENGKYIRLFGTIFFTFIGFILANVLILIILRLFFGLLSFIPGFYNIFTLFIVTVPAALFITVYLIYFKRTMQHPAKFTRYFSYCIFTIALAAWGVFLVMDLILYFKYFYNGIDKYNTYNLAFLSANVFAIFFVGIVQALNTKKELGWMEKHANKEV